MHRLHREGAEMPGGCFGNDPYDRWLESLADEHYSDVLTEEEMEAANDAQDRLDAMKEDAEEARRDDERNMN